MTCLRCHRDQPLDAFYADKSVATGRRSVCKGCTKAAAVAKRRIRRARQRRACSPDEAVVQQFIHRIYIEDFSLGHA